MKRNHYMNQNMQPNLKQFFNHITTYSFCDVTLFLIKIKIKSKIEFLQNRMLFQYPFELGYENRIVSAMLFSNFLFASIAALSFPTVSLFSFQNGCLSFSAAINIMCDRNNLKKCPEESNLLHPCETKYRKQFYFIQN